MREMSAAAKDCPLAPPEHASVYARALHRACLVLGGVDQLAKHLGVSGERLSQWLRGEEQPPEQAFLEAVEVVLLHAGGAGRAN
jgi:transcriptional regulator with XRE-family HTH domain